MDLSIVLITQTTFSGSVNPVVSNNLLVQAPTVTITFLALKLPLFVSIVTTGPGMSPVTL